MTTFMNEHITTETIDDLMVRNIHRLTKLRIYEDDGTKVRNTTQKVVDFGIWFPTRATAYDAIIALSYDL